MSKKMFTADFVAEANQQSRSHFPIPMLRSRLTICHQRQTVNPLTARRIRRRHSMVDRGQFFQALSIPTSLYHRRQLVQRIHRQKK